MVRVYLGLRCIFRVGLCLLPPSLPPLLACWLAVLLGSCRSTFEGRFLKKKWGDLKINAPFDHGTNGSKKPSAGMIPRHAKAATTRRVLGAKKSMVLPLRTDYISSGNETWQLKILGLKLCKWGFHGKRSINP
jgi:hypothetical protein